MPDAQNHTGRTAADSNRRVPRPQVDAQPVGGDDRKTATRGAIFIGCALAAFVVYLALTGQVAQFMGALSSVQVPWLLIACLCMLLYLVFGIAAYAIAVWLDPNSPVGIRDLISVEASGIFFGNLTPMMMGSTPAQIYRLTKAGQNVGEAGATQFTRFIVYQFGLVAWGAILLIARMPYFAERYGDMTLLCVFSFGGHVGILLLIFAIALMPKTVIRVGHWGLSILARIGFPSDKVASWSEVLDGEVESFSEKFKLAAGHASSMALTVVITMLQLAFFYLVPYFLMRSFGHHDVDFFSVMAASAFVQLLSSAVPLPGGTGGAEGGFALFLGHFYGSAATAGYLLWRLITFIAPTIVAAPLLGLKSAHHASIHERWDRVFGSSKRKSELPTARSEARLRERVAEDAGRPDAVGTRSKGQGLADAQGRGFHDGGAAFDGAASEEAGRPIPESGMPSGARGASSAARARKPAAAHVRRTPGGITVNPSALERRRQR